MQVKLLHSILLKILLTFLTLVICEPNGIYRIAEWFYVLRADGRHCSFSTLTEESQISDVEEGQIIETLCLFL